MSLNFYKDAAIGTKEVVLNSLTMSTEAMRRGVANTIGGIANWTIGSIGSVLMYGAKTTGKAVLNAPIVALPI